MVNYVFLLFQALRCVCGLSFHENIPKILHQLLTYQNKLKSFPLARLFQIKLIVLRCTAYTKIFSNFHAISDSFNLFWHHLIQFTTSFLIL